jgi:hypothetical protein
VELDFAAAAPLQDVASLLAHGDSDFGGDGYDDDDGDDVLFEDALASEEAVLPPRLESGGGTEGAAAPVAESGRKDRGRAAGSLRL